MIKTFSRNYNWSYYLGTSQFVNKDTNANYHGKLFRFHQQIQNVSSRANFHLICLKDWDANLVMTILKSALSLKCQCSNTHKSRQFQDILPCAKVMILEDHSEPLLRMAIAKATSFLGATDVHITQMFDWDQDYNGRVFSEMADVIFVSSLMHGCMKLFSKHSSVPVLCMRTRRHAPLQALSTMMSIVEDYGKISRLNVAYVGTPHQVLNDYLILCPLLGANIKFKCCCNTCPVSPLLYGDSKTMCKEAHTKSKQVKQQDDAIVNANVIIAGPTTTQAEKLPEFKLCTASIEKQANKDWTYYHTLPRGAEAEDDLFWHCRARTFNALKNTQYVAAALLAYAVKKYNFGC